MVECVINPISNIVCGLPVECFEILALFLDDEGINFWLYVLNCFKNGEIGNPETALKLTCGYNN